MLSKILAGVLGFVFGGVIVMLVKIKRVRKKINGELQKDVINELADLQKTKVEGVITEKRKLYKKKNKGVIARDVLGLKKKKQNVFPKAYVDIIKDVSAIFDEDGQRPYLKFSVKSGFEFLQRVIDRVESVLNATEISVLKNLKISTIADVTKISSKVFTNKAVKTGMSFSKRFFNLLNVVNPYHWIKKIVLSIFFTKIINEILLASVDIVAWEFARFYEQGQRQTDLKTVA